MTKSILGALKLVVISEAGPIPAVPQLIDENKVFMANGPMTAGAKLMFDELQRWAVALKTMR
jgi:hypothetical protein